MDVRQNFTKMSQDDRQRVIKAIKWMKGHDRTGAGRAVLLEEGTDPGFRLGGLYQRYVLFHSQGGVTAPLSDFKILSTENSANTLHSIVIDGEEWVSTAKYPVTEAGLRDFLKDIPLSSGRNATGGPFNDRPVDPPLPLLGLITGHFNNSPFGNIRIRTIPSGSTTPAEFAFTRTDKPGAKYQLRTYEMAHRSPAFLPWHRVFLRLFEKDLQFADKHLGKDGKITLPYWNWIHDTDWDETSKSSVWHKENFGGFSHELEGTITGDHFSPTSTWKLVSSDPGDVTRTALTGTAGELRRRRTDHRVSIAADGAAEFPTVQTAKPVVNNSLYIDETTIGGLGVGHTGTGGNNQFAGAFEHRLHDLVHLVVGGIVRAPRTQIGQMSDMLLSPQDPIFWLFHCNVDRIWSRWQWFYDKALQYPRFGMLPGRRRNDLMEPWGTAAPPYQFNIRVEDVLNAANFGSAVNSTDLLGKGYQYDSLKL
jgi:hypothetical protein